MKNYLIVLLLGFAAAALKEDIQKETENTVTAFNSGLQKATPLHIALGVENSENLQRLENDIKEELKKHIEEAFDKALKKIEDAIANKKEVNKEAVKMLKDLKDKLKELNIEDHEVTEKLEVLKAKIDEHLRKILEKLGIFDKRSIEQGIPAILTTSLRENIKSKLSKLKKWILEKLDAKTLKEAFAKIIGEATKNVCEWITDKSKEKSSNFFDRFLDLDPKSEKLASENRYSEIHDYLKSVEVNIDAKLGNFKKWLHDLLDKGIDEAKEKIKKVTEIMKEIIEESKKGSKKEIADLLKFIREFEDKFGSLYDIRHVVEEILKQND